MKSSRREAIKAALAAGGLATFAMGYSHTLGKMTKGQWAGDRPGDRIAGLAPKPEFSVDLKTGELVVNPDQGVSYTMCTGCTTYCGVRVRIDKKTGDVLRVAGNPFSPLSAAPALAYETSIRDSFISLSRWEESGLAHRSTACGRGNAVLEFMKSPFRVTTPLKRVGPRGSGKWEPISFEQLVQEVVEGGNLFGEGPVEGLGAIRDLAAPIDPQQPELGPKANQLAVIDAVADGRGGFVQRFLRFAFGSVNYSGHGSYCGGAYRSGSGALFGDHKKMPHAKPDFRHAEFILFVGTSPGNAGNPFKRQGQQLAAARSDGHLKYVVVDPVLNNSNNLATSGRGGWVPIKPGTDGALAMGMMRWMFENERYDARYLSFPNLQAAEAAGEASWTNATHLVIQDPEHPRDGHFLRGCDIGIKLPEEKRYGEEDPFVVLPLDGETPIAHDRHSGEARLFFAGEVETPSGKVKVKTGLTLLREEAEKHTLAEYAQICGVPERIVAGLAQELTSHGKKAAVDSHGGMMAGNGFYNTYALMTLNALIGNLNWKGGWIFTGGRFQDAGPGPRYNLADFPGKVVPKGIPLSRNVPFAKTSESKRAGDRGAKAPWYPAAAGLATETLLSAFNAYPYGLKALILRDVNPVYGVPGLHRMLEKLADPKVIPLIISIDPFINETSAYADYIVPDVLLYESWGWATPWAGVATTATTGRWPVVAPQVGELPHGQPICMETFFIAVAKKMRLPGFGKDAIPGADGNLHPLETPEDYYLRGGANIAYQGAPVPDASDDDITLSGVTRILPALKRTLKEEEWRKVAYVLARGGRYENEDQAYQGEYTRHRYKRPLQIYSEGIGTARNGRMQGRFSGTATWTPPVFSDGTPVRAVYSEKDWPFTVVSYKSPLQNSYSIGASRLRQIHPDNPVAIHPDDAQALGIEHGSRIRITTPGGQAYGRALVRRGIQRGVVAIEHGFGHRELGARRHQIGGKMLPHRPELSAGISLNDLGMADPTREGSSFYLDPIAGTAVRQGLPAKVEPA